MQPELYSLSDVAEMLKVQPHRILYLLSTRVVPEPFRVGGRRLWSLPEIALVAEKLKIQLGTELEGERQTDG